MFLKGLASLAKTFNQHEAWCQFSNHLCLNFAAGFSEKCKATLYWRSIRAEKTSIKENTDRCFQKDHVKRGRGTGYGKSWGLYEKYNSSLRTVPTNTKEFSPSL